MEDIVNLNMLVDKANNNSLTAIRLAGWEKIIKWEVGEREYFWTTSGKKISNVSQSNPDIVLKCSPETLERLALGKLPFLYWNLGNR